MFDIFTHFFSLSFLYGSLKGSNCTCADPWCASIYHWALKWVVHLKKKKKKKAFADNLLTPMSYGEKSRNYFIKNLNFFSTAERKAWTSWMTWGSVNYQQKFFFFFVFFLKWTTPLRLSAIPVWLRLYLHVLMLLYLFIWKTIYICSLQNFHLLAHWTGKFRCVSDFRELFWVLNKQVACNH